MLHNLIVHADYVSKQMPRGEICKVVISNPRAEKIQNLQGKKKTPLWSKIAKISNY